MNRKFSLMLGVGALALVLVIPAFAHAQAQQGSPAQPAPSTPAQPNPGMPLERGWGLRGMHGLFGMRGMGHGGMALLPALAKATGLTTDEIRQQLAEGKTAAQIAESKGKTAEDVVKVARADVKAMLDQAVANQWLTQALADARLKAFDAMAPEMMKAAPAAGGPRGFMKPFGRHGDCPGMDGGTNPDGSAQPDAGSQPNTRGRWFQRLLGGNDA